MTLRISRRILGFASGGLFCLVGAAAAAAPSEVTIQTYAFHPATLTVAAGTMVEWVNKDETPHTILSADKDFKSGALDTGDKFSFVFAKPGTYKYFCTMHPQMVGTVIVK